MLARRPLLDRPFVQTTLIGLALTISTVMLVPPLSPVLGDSDVLTLFGPPAGEEPVVETIRFVGSTGELEPVPRREPVDAKGILMSGYTAGGSRFDDLLELIEWTELNAVVIDIKDERGEISWIPHSDATRAGGAGLPKILDPAATVRRLHNADIYVIGRLVVFQDSIMAAARPDLALRDVDGGIWRTFRGQSWLDPYSTEAQNYNLALAIEAVELGFDEIQFDYIRFPSDGDMTRVWSRHRDLRRPDEVIRDFLARARQELVPRGAYVSADLFGLTALVQDHLGIGQSIELMAQQVDYISPMVYPSHYNKPEYGIPDPELEPYRTVSVSLEDAKRRIAGTGAKLRPWLQDFTLRVPYTPVEVRAQIEATHDAGIDEWLLWNARNRYSEDALRPAPDRRQPPPEDSTVAR